MTQAVVIFVTVALLLGAVLAAALGRAVGRVAFAKRWILYALAIVGIEIAAVLLGQTTRSVLCGSVWYAECL